MKRLLVIAVLILGLIAIPVPSAEATHNNWQGCGISWYYGAPTWTVARDTGKPYCDVQARVWRYVNGQYRSYTDRWKLYESSVFSSAGSPVYLFGPNCARFRKRNHDGSIAYTSPWYCKHG